MNKNRIKEMRNFIRSLMNFPFSDRQASTFGIIKFSLTLNENKLK